MLPISINGELAIGARIVTPEIGAWIADVDLDLNVPILPAGRVTILIGTTALIGTVDPRATGYFGAKANVRVVGGGNGWDKQVRPQSFPNDFGVLSSAVISATAAEVGEVAVDVLPQRLGANYGRCAGPASRVLAGREWFVDSTGTTIVGPRPPLPLSPLVDILSWDPLSRRAELASDDIILPGSILVDTRFGTAVVRDVEQTFNAGGARASVWCKPLASSAEPTRAGARLGRALASVAIEAVRPDLLREYHYRIATQDADGRLNLQLVSADAGAPPIIPRVSVWPGMAGLSALFSPGTECIVEFLDGDPGKPVVVGFKDDVPPIMLKLGSAIQPIALATSVLAAISALQTAVAAAASGLVAITGTPGSPFVPLTPAHATAAAGAVSAVTTALAALSAATATLPSIRTFSD